MKRNIIKVSDYSVTLTGNNIWMTYWEIAEAFNVIPASVNRTIKRMFKENVFLSVNIANISDCQTATMPMFTVLM